jgi:hypothetical protein
MRHLLVVCCWLAWVGNAAVAQTNPAPPVDDPNTAAAAKVASLYQAWAAEHDSAKRADLAGQLIQAIIHDYDKQHVDIADEVARDGLPRNDVRFYGTVSKVLLSTRITLPGVHDISCEFPASPVFRRIAANRVEAWTAKEGWLFDGQGKVLVHVNVPRRDGAGREWFGAFLPDGTWVTTDIWDNDQQLNCYDAHGKWLWELTGKEIFTRLPKLPADTYEPDVPRLIDWARADKTGKSWLVSVGANLTMQEALVDERGRVKKLPAEASLWGQVYPRSMGVRGGYVAFSIDSDDGKESFGFTTVAHGPNSNWPSFTASSGWGMTLHDPTLSFGFWPHSHAVYIQQEGADAQSPDIIWSFDAKGRYQGEVTGASFGDAANGRDLLVKDADDRVLRISLGKAGLAIPDARQFSWPDGSVAVPLALYDDLHLGFFLRGAGMAAATDDARRARGAADVVLAKWKD